MSGDSLQPTPVEREVAKAFEAIRNSDAEYEHPIIQKCLGELTAAARETVRRMEIVEKQSTLSYHNSAIRSSKEAIRAAEVRLGQLGPL